MALNTMIPTGRLFTMTQNVVYALPASRVLLVTEGTPTLVQAVDEGMAAPIAITLTNGQAELAGRFIKSTAGAATITLKEHA